MKSVRRIRAFRIVGALALAGVALGGLPGCVAVPAGGYYGGGYGYGGTRIYVAPSYGYGGGYGYGRGYGHDYGRGEWGGGYGRGGGWRY